MVNKSNRKTKSSNRPRLSRLTLGLGLYLIISAAFARQAWDWISGIVAQANLNFFFIAIFSLLLMLVVVTTFKSNFSIGRLVINITTIIAAFLFAWWQPFFAEKIHVLEYGLLGWLTMRDLNKNQNAFKSVLLTILFVLLIGSLDEIFQKILPYRVGEIRDALTNMVSGVFGVILFLAK